MRFFQEREELKTNSVGGQDKHAMEEPRHYVLMNIWNIIQTMETKDLERKRNKTIAMLQEI